MIEVIQAHATVDRIVIGLMAAGGMLLILQAHVFRHMPRQSYVAVRDAMRRMDYQTAAQHLDQRGRRDVSLFKHSVVAMLALIALGALLTVTTTPPSRVAP